MENGAPGAGAQVRVARLAQESGLAEDEILEMEQNKRRLGARVRGCRTGDKHEERARTLRRENIHGVQSQTLRCAGRTAEERHAALRQEVRRPD